MMSGFLVIGVALATVLVLALTPRRRPHGTGCNCGKCSLWLLERKL